MSTDRSLAVFAGQFVPLKLTTDGNPEWSRWTRQYPHEGNGIPILYVVRADGEKLYAKTGSLPGGQLLAMLAAAASQSGRVFNDEESTILAEVVKTAKEQRDAEDYPAMAATLASLRRLGDPGSLRSYAAPAIEADQLVNELVESQTASIAAALRQAAGEDATSDALDDSRVAAVMQLVEYDNAFGSFPPLRKTTGEALQQVKKSAALREIVPLAEALERGRRYAESDSASARKRAVGVYEQLLRRDPPPLLAAKARGELQRLDPQSSLLSDAPDRWRSLRDAFRIWTDRSGRFKVEAKLESLEDGRVTLQTRDGRTITLPLDQLSQADQELLR